MESSPDRAPSAYARLFWIWLVGRTALWFGVAVCTLPNAPLDLLEWLAWGFQFTWGFPKHPPLPAWVCGAFAWLSPGDVWGVYLCSYLHVAVCLWAAWQLGREFLSPRCALLAAICLDGLTYMTGDAAEFSNNVSLNVAWALTVLFFVRAVRTEKLRWWLALGITVGLGLLCKYTLGVLLVAVFSYMIFDRDGRRLWKQPGPYLAGLLALVIFCPHAIWVARHDFITFHYAVERSTSDSRWGHVLNPLGFLAEQLLTLTPVLLVLAPMLIGRGKGERVSPQLAVLHWAVIGPVGVLLALSMTSGCQLRGIWGSPLWTFLGVWVLACAGTIAPEGLRWSSRAWAAGAVALLAFFVIKNNVCPYVLGRPTHESFPGKQLAAEVARRWHAGCSEPFAIVAGEAWRADNVCCYSRHRPMIYTSGAMGYFVFEPQHCPWTSDADLAQRGGVLLWDARQLGDELPAAARKRFADAEAQTPIVLPFQSGAAFKSDRTGVAFIWPKNVRTNVVLRPNRP